MLHHPVPFNLQLASCRILSNFAAVKTADANYWNDRWKNGETGWDMGAPSTPLKEFIDTLEDKNMRILIPGCGNAYEAEYLHEKGFKNVFVVDFAQKAIDEFSQRVPSFPKDHLFCADFFALNESGFDLVLEQTFFCAIDPAMRKRYAEKMNALLAPGGELAGLLFNDPELGFENPPFGGNADEYRAIFQPYFTFEKFETAQNSIAPRAGRELFIRLHRKENHA